MVMGITSISIIMTVVVLNFHYVSPVNKKELPQWLRRMIRSQVILDQHYVCNEDDDGEEALGLGLDIEEMMDDEIELKETPTCARPAMDYDSVHVPWNNVNHKVPITTMPPTTTTTIPPPVAFQPNNISTSGSNVNLLSRHNKVHPPHLMSHEAKKMKKGSARYFGNCPQASYGRNEMGTATTGSATAFGDNETETANAAFKVRYWEQQQRKHLIIENIY